MKLSIVIPAHNEEKNIGKCVEELLSVVRDRSCIPCEVIVVNDDSSDGTEAEVRELQRREPGVVSLVSRRAPCGFGRAIRSGLEHVTGDVVVIYMADLSDDPEDVVLYYRKIQEGYDCVFGSRFIRGSKVEKYPLRKLIANRIVNRCVQIMFWTRCNDLTNAFKAYRTGVIRDCGPYRSCHFNITLEMSLGALVRGYEIAQVPIRWYGRTWGTSKLKIRDMGRRYLCSLLMLFFQRRLIADDLLAEKRAARIAQQGSIAELEARIRRLENEVERLGAGVREPEVASRA
jgi:dolichol-phosphate mannosyltransferase